MELIHWDRINEWSRRLGQRNCAKNCRRYGELRSADDEFHQKGSLYKNLIGSKISIEKKDGTIMTLEVKDISISFSIANNALIGINVKEDIHAEEIKKGSKVLLLE